MNVDKEVIVGEIESLQGELLDNTELLASVFNLPAKSDFVRLRRLVEYAQELVKFEERFIKTSNQMAASDINPWKDWRSELNMMVESVESLCVNFSQVPREVRSGLLRGQRERLYQCLVFLRSEREKLVARDV